MALVSDYTNQIIQPQYMNWQLSSTVPSNGTGYYGTPQPFGNMADGYSSYGYNTNANVSPMGTTTRSPNYIDGNTLLTTTPSYNTVNSIVNGNGINNTATQTNTVNTTNTGTTNNGTGSQLKANIGQASLFDKTNAILGGVGSVINAYNAYKANKLATKQFNHAVDVHNKNWDAQRKQTNSQLEDRQRRRVEEAAANGRTTTSVADYMAKYGV